MAALDQRTELAGATHPAPPRVAALVALKRPEMAKSRLATLPSPLRSRLAWTMALDTLRALGAVLPVIVISNHPDLADRLSREGIPSQVIAEPVAAGINAALRHGEDVALAAGFSGTLACVGDLPALRPDSVRTVLSAGTGLPRAFVADRSGEGTTMLISCGVPLNPLFQGSSAAAHRASGAQELGFSELGSALADARTDVDSEEDLADAFKLGLGPATRQLFDASGRLARYTVIIKEGKRLHAVISGGRVLSTWSS